MIGWQDEWPDYNLGNTTLPMKLGTSPAIAALGTGVEIAFEASTGFLWYLPPTGAAVATKAAMQTGTSPSITVY